MKTNKEILIEMIKWLDECGNRELDCLKTTMDELNFLSDCGYKENSKRVKAELLIGKYHLGKHDFYCEVARKLNLLTHD